MPLLIAEGVSRLLNAVRDPCRKPNGSMRPKGGRATAAEPTEKERSEPVSPFLNLRNAAVLDPCRRPNGSVRPKGDRSAAAAADPTAVRVPCRMPNGSVRPKGGSGAVVGELSAAALALRDPCRMPNSSMRPKGGSGAVVDATGRGGSEQVS
jgi:hypothetical protein